MTDHAFLAPSAAHIWGPGGCAYYPTMAAAYPDTGDHPEAREGTAAHHLLAQRLWGVVLEVGALDPDGTPITAEMFECTDDFVRDVEGLRAQYPDLVEHTEQRVTMPSVHAHNWGTSDWFAYSKAARLIWLKDFKFGHRYVDAWENWQLADYLIGVLGFFGIASGDVTGAALAIYQPRCYHPDGPVKTWNVQAGQFVDLSAKLARAAAAAMSPDPAMTTGNHCQDCEGQTKCPALRRACGNGIDLSYRGVPNDMDDAARGTYRTMLAAAIKRLEGMATGLDADIEASIRAGGRVPGWELKPGQPRLAWAADTAELYVLGQAMGVPLFTEVPYGEGETLLTGLITPTQAIKNGIDEAVIMEYAKRPPAGLKVAQADSNAASKAFK